MKQSVISIYLIFPSIMVIIMHVINISTYKLLVCALCSEHGIKMQFLHGYVNNQIVKSTNKMVKGKTVFKVEQPCL